MYTLDRYCYIVWIIRSIYDEALSLCDVAQHLNASAQYQQLAHLNVVHKQTHFTHDFFTRNCMYI